MIRRPPRSTQSRSSAASDVYKRQPLRNAVRRDIVDRVEETRVVAAGPLRQRLYPRQRSKRRSGFVETDMSGAANPEDLQIDAAGLSDRTLVVGACRLNRTAVARNMHECRGKPERLNDLARDDRAIALRMIFRQTNVFVQRESAQPGQVDTTVGGTVRERSIDRERAGSGCQTEHGIRLAGDQRENGIRNQRSGSRGIRNNHDLGHYVTSLM